MSDLEAFRAETRAWLEDNCPPSMRTPMKGEADFCWGGRKFKFQSDDQKKWLERMASRAGPCPHGRRNMVVAVCRKTKPKSWRPR